MKITVNGALALKNELQERVETLGRSLERSRVTTVVEVSPEGKETDITEKTEDFETVYAEWCLEQDKLIILEIALLDFNVKNGVAEAVRRRNLAKSRIEANERILEKMTERKTRPSSMTPDPTVKFLLYRPLWAKSGMKDRIKALKAAVRSWQAKIDSANTQEIELPFSVD